MEVVGEAEDGLEALELARETQPEIILMDIGMPKCNGLEATRLIRHEMPKTKIIIVTVSEHDEDLFEALKCGAQAYLIKNLREDQLFAAVESVATGEAFFSGVIAAKILREFQKPGSNGVEQPKGGDLLTNRETDVLELVVEGLTNAEIASRLVVAETTVRSHLGRILEKLQLRNRVQAAVYAVRHGIVEDHG
jgi:DNA-binding NarL/FixJ family response regulator